MAEYQLILGEISRMKLAAWLRGRSRPRKINPIRYAQFQNGESALIKFSELGELIDAFDSTILDYLRWPLTQGERRRFA